MNDVQHSRDGVAGVVASLLGVGDSGSCRIEAFDGSAAGPDVAPTTVVIASPDALVRFIHSPGELGLARAYACGDIEVRGDIMGVFELVDGRSGLSVTPRHVADMARIVGRRGLRRLPVPPEEVVPRGRLHSLRRDLDAVSHHYDVSNAFYGLFLDESMTYSCAVFEQPGWSLEQAQAAKHELALRKLGLRPGMRVLDIGCGWGAHAIHAARHFDVDVVGVTLATEQVELGRKRVAEAGLSNRIELRLQDYRAVDDGPYDAVTSIGMFEHVGWDRAEEFIQSAAGVLRPGGRMMLHSITSPTARRPGRSRRQFIYRYIFPDGELQPIGRIVDELQRNGFDVADVDALNLHYAETLRHWLGRLESNWGAAVADVGVNRARIWRLYLGGCQANFLSRKLQVQQVTAAKPNADGTSALPRRPDWRRTGLDEYGRSGP